MKLLITGIHGFVGGSVGFFADAAGHSVLGVDLPVQPPAGWRQPYHQADVAHAELAALIDEFCPDAVLHAAGSASVANSYQVPVEDLRSAALTLANVLDAVRRSERRPRVLFPSSAAVYGNPQQLPVREDAPIAPISPYGFHKAASELVAREYAECFGLDVVVARLFSVYGPRQRRLLVWELYRQAAGDDREVVLQGTGDETRDYLYMDDLAAAFLTLAGARHAGFVPVNVASGTEVRVRDLAQTVADLCGGGKPVRALGEKRRGDPTNWRADVRRLREMGVTEPVPLEEGLSRCIERWRCESE